MQHSKSLPLLALILPAACSAASDPADTGTSKSDLIGFPQPIPTFPGPIPTFEPPPPRRPAARGGAGNGRTTEQRVRTVQLPLRLRSGRHLLR